MRNPLITLGDVASPVVRTGGQVFTGAFLVQGLDEFWPALFTPSQELWLAAAVGAGLAWVQNTIEQLKNRRLVGTTGQ